MYSLCCGISCPCHIGDMHGVPFWYFLWSLCRILHACPCWLFQLQRRIFDILTVWCRHILHGWGLGM
jgi:hypothetical protein